jgi:predicted amidohydrolase YtcJ
MQDKIHLKASFFSLILLNLLVICSCKSGDGITTDSADAIYFNGDIITMEGDSAAYAQAVAIKDGKIVFVGAQSDAEKLRGDSTVMNDLNGKTLLPGFIDAHSHFMNSLSLSEQANCYPAPFGPGNTVAGIIAALQQLQQEKNIPKGEFISAYGYDENAIDRPLTAKDLDKAFPDHPVMVGHVSLHGAVLNNVALKKYDITAATKTPPGGVILRVKGTNEPEGLLMETAFLPVFSNLPKATEAQQVEALSKAQAIYAAAGITTAQEGATHLSDLQTLQKGADAGKFYIDLIAYPFITDLDNIIKENPVSSFGKYHNRLKLGGAKITSDGSPQGKTAYFSTPYLTGGPAGEKNWRGEPTFPYAQYEKMIKHVADLGLDMIVHCNGDASIDDFLKAYEAALGDKVTEDRRTGIIHSQFVRKDQLEKYAKYHIIPSFFTEHTYFFGDTHIKNRGEKQAAYLSPMRDAIDMKILSANHTDFAVNPIDQLFVVWTAVNRITRSGKVLGPDQRITPYEALKAITVVPAYWYREEKNKGSITAGKLADLVILDQNPLKADLLKIKDIIVLETIKEGKSVYRK